MGLFGVFGGEKSDETIALADDPVARAVLTPAVSTMIGDGDVNDAEMAQLSNLIAFSPIFGDHGPAAVSGFVNYIIETIRQNGHDETIKAAAAELPEALRETALCFAMRIALADGKIEDGEKASLAQTGGHLGVTPERFGQIFGVIAALQHPRPE